MWNLIEKLRSQPRHLKTHVSFLGAILGTFAIGVIWMFSLPARFSSPVEVIEQQSAIVSDAKGVADILFKNDFGLQATPSPQENEEEEAGSGSAHQDNTASSGQPVLIEAGKNKGDARPEVLIETKPSAQ